MSGQPNVENGHNAEENHVSNTSSSWIHPSSLGASIPTYTSLSLYQAGILCPHHNCLEIHQSYVISIQWFIIFSNLLGTKFTLAFLSCCVDNTLSASGRIFTNHCFDKYGSIKAPLLSLNGALCVIFSILNNKPCSFKSFINFSRHSNLSRPTYKVAFSFIVPLELIHTTLSKLCLKPTSKSLGSWAGVILTQPVPFSISACSSPTIGINLFTIGKITFFPIYLLYLSSSGLTATAVSPNKVSGLVVATSKYSSLSSNWYFKW